MYEIPVWQMLKEAATSISGDVIPIVDIKKYISEHYGQVNEGTITVQLMTCCVNRSSRLHYPENSKPRIANGQYDFLYYLGRGFVTLYDPSKHGQWEIAIQDGKRFVRQIGDSAKSLVPSGFAISRPIPRVAQRRSKIRLDIEKPNTEIVKRYIEKWDTLENYKAQEHALNKLFWELCPANTNLDDVLLKVAALNTFYSTNIYNVFAVARHIIKLNIDERLRQGDDSLVTDIAKGHGLINKRHGKEIHIFSFATKYCSHHRPDVYPIYDSYVEDFLIYLKNADGFTNFDNEALRDIKVFKGTLKKLQEFYGLESFSLKEIDQYLWQYGKEKFPNNYGRKKNSD